MTGQRPRLEVADALYRVLRRIIDEQHESYADPDEEAIAVLHLWEAQQQMADMPPSATLPRSQPAPPSPEGCGR